MGTLCTNCIQADDKNELVTNVDIDLADAKNIRRNSNAAINLAEGYQNYPS